MSDQKTWWSTRVSSIFLSGNLRRNSSITRGDRIENCFFFPMFDRFFETIYIYTYFSSFEVIVAS